MDEITKRVIEFLKSTGLNQVQLQEATGIKQSNISKILNGERPAKEAIVNKLVFSPLKADRQYLMTGIKSGDKVVENIHALLSNNTTKKEYRKLSAADRIFEFYGLSRDEIGSISDFERFVGIQEGYILNAIEEGLIVDDFVFDLIIKKFPYLNRDWLVYGEGGMLAAEDYSKEQYKTKYIESLETINSHKDEISQLKDEISRLKDEISRLNDLVTQLSSGSADGMGVIAG